MRGLHLASLVCAPALLSSPVPTAAQEKPNIIWIMADELGYGDLGAYGQKKIRTVGQVPQDAGYRTALVNKWHLEATLRRVIREELRKTG